MAENLAVIFTRAAAKVIVLTLTGALLFDSNMGVPHPGGEGLEFPPPDELVMRKRERK